MKMRRFSITGWWSQPSFPTLAIVKDRAGIVSIENAHAFSGILTVHDDGKIDDNNSVLFDKNGLATVMNGTFDHLNGIILFDKMYACRNDIISYKATFRTEQKCWRGTFDGNATGQGTTAFVVQELPDSLFV